MFSKDPSELTRKEKFDSEEIGRSIRLALAAELDAINFYMQQSKLMPEGAFKKVHEDIAKEEVTHFGEFLRLMHEYVPEDFEKIRGGWDEASAMLGSNPDVLPSHSRHAAPSADSSQNELLPSGLHYYPWNENGLLLPGKTGKIVPFEKVELEFTVQKDMNDIYKKLYIERKEREYESLIEEYVYEESKFSLRNASSKLSGTKADAESIFTIFQKALSMLYSKNFDRGLVAHVSMELHAKLVSTTLGNESLYKIVTRLIPSLSINHSLKGSTLIIFQENVFRVAINKPPKMHMISETMEIMNYGISAWILPLLLEPEASVVVEFK
jgi:Uncharacterized conserved protein